MRLASKNEHQRHTSCFVLISLFPVELLANCHIIRIAMAEQNKPGIVHVEARDLVHPAHLSAAAQMSLNVQKLAAAYPDASDKEAWRAQITATDNFLSKMAGAGVPAGTSEVEEKSIAGVRVYIVTPHGLAKDDRNVVLEMHGGALIYGGGETCKIMATRTATKLRRRIWTIDYRMPPDHPYPAGLDDCVAVYKVLLEERKPGEIIHNDVYYVQPK